MYSGTISCHQIFVDMAKNAIQNIYPRSIIFLQSVLTVCQVETKDYSGVGKVYYTFYSSA